MKKAKDIIATIGALFLLGAIVASIVFGIYKAVTDRTGEKVWVEDAQSWCKIQGNGIALCPGKSAWDTNAESYESQMKIRHNLVSQGCAVSPMPYIGEFALSYMRTTVRDIRNCYHDK